ncbi:MAG: DNA cytosine methyltransferase [Candidatus Ventricola sp.]
MNQAKLTLGSLFDGIGGFCLAGQMAGIKPVWASEIEPFPIRVTEKRFPEVRQLGDIHALRGADIPPVDVITFGSPCQNLSCAGKRAGLHGEQSSLFFEAVRIIKEMRRSTHGQYPRWAVWENVPGALSSNAGHDFRAVLQSLAEIADESADVPMPENGKWLGAGEIVGNDYSLAWRILDASKGWGVAQRRRRIFAVLDLAGACAGQVLFESEGLSGYTPPGGEARQGAARGAEESTGKTGICLNDQGGSRMDVTHEMTCTLRAKANHPPCVMGASGFCTEHSANSRGIGFREEESPTLRAGVTPGVAIEFNPTDSRIRVKEDGVCQTLCSRMGTGGNQVPLVFGISADQSNAMLSGNPHSGIYEARTSRTLDCSGGSPSCNQGGMMVVAPMQDVSYCIQGSMIGRRDENGPHGDGVNKDVSFTLNTIDRHAVCAMNVGFFTTAEGSTPALLARDYKDPPIVSPTAEYLVRRLTPDECCRLQGYPDGWCAGLDSEAPSEAEVSRWREIFAVWDGIQGKSRPKTDKQIIKWLRHPNTDAAEYKAYGNSVAVPCVFFVLAGIAWAAGKEQSE